VTRIVTILLLALCLAAPLSACGKKGDPNPPDPAHNQYPRTYPR
jgi:predicted small lipoprotein YifL